MSYSVADNNGSIFYYKDNKFHNEEGPAIIYYTGDKEWCKNGELHREDGPAVECADGDKEWWVNGKLHREDGPAVELSNGNKEYWIYDINISSLNLMIKHYFIFNKRHSFV